MFCGNNQSMEEDFKIAEFQGDNEDSLYVDMRML